jgi:hypothetical protein
MYSTHHPCWDAKNRYNLPEQMEMSFEPLAALFDGVEPEPDYRAKLREVMKDMTDEQKADVINKYNLGPATDNTGYKKAYEDITGGKENG